MDKLDNYNLYKQISDLYLSCIGNPLVPKQKHIVSTTKIFIVNNETMERIKIEDIGNKDSLFWQIDKLNEKITDFENEINECKKRDIKYISDSDLIIEMERRGFVEYLPPPKKIKSRLLELE